MAQLRAGAMYATRPSFHFNSAISGSETTFPQTRRTHWQPHPLRHLKYAGAGAPGHDAGKPEDFEILLCTRGPAVRLIGTLDPYGREKLNVSE
jgi:hypothetical protein